MFKAAVFLTCAYLWIAMVDSAVAREVAQPQASTEVTATDIITKKIQQVITPPTKPPTPEEIAAKKLRDAVADAKKQCAKEKLDLLHTVISDFKSLVDPMAELRKKYEDLRDLEMKKQS
ncbi:MAG: hypothetical protein ABFQ95_00225 [Pseudomonadota bacterium]